MMRSMDDGTVYRLDELAAAAGVSARTVRYYVQRGLLPSPEFRGRDTVYGEAHLWRLRAIRRLQAGLLSLDAIEAELGRRDLDGIARLARGEEAPGAPLGVPEAADAVEPARGAEGRWCRFELAPGLELHLSEDAGDEVRALAREIRKTSERRRAGRPGGER